VTKPTSIATRRALPISPLSIQLRIVDTAGEEAKGKLTAPRSPASATNARASATSTASGFSLNTLLPAANAARACWRCEAGGEAM
jgi:hypothetical protein